MALSQPKTDRSPKVWLAPAKINLFLHITGQRENGYHELQTVFQFLDFSDELSYKILDNNEIIHVNPLPGVKPEDDLIVKAAHLLQQHTNCQQGAQIAIKKNLPMGGGLGGGSSDAATTLVALNQLWQLNIELPELAKLGLKLGADVPIFIQGVAAWAEGVGEDLSPILLDESYFMVLIPRVSVSTADIFASPVLKRDCIPISIEQFLSGTGNNVCESVVREHYPEVDLAIQWLGQFSQARMTGTGACVFAPFATQAEAQQILSRKPEQFDGFIAKGLNISPLYRL
ncbi:MAG: 4-(cytidine 5'-diphospho)-2-C-methyl-D-erythritol kinase [gamma proteobacterium symbiont of Taylorina sp.]|nr:4-(cytidine 5'-diphospho)-2-C-methyl-D-erythritol kinase [gamma proteobacterium symbiont of Taylorina sp.]